MRTMHWVIIGVIAIGMIALIATGKADVTNVIILGLLSLCPIAMMLMRGGHGGDKGGHKH